MVITLQCRYFLGSFLFCFVHSIAETTSKTLEAKLVIYRPLVVQKIMANDPQLL